MFKQRVKELLEEGLSKRPDLFLLDFTVGANNHIKVTLDGDKGVNLTDCMEISRAIEHNLDREEEDFSLEVTSAGATEPLVMPRQYPKNIGRKIEVTTEAEVFQGILEEVTDQAIVLKWKQREPKAVGKGKHTVEKETIVNFEHIKTAKVILKI